MSVTSSGSKFKGDFAFKAVFQPGNTPVADPQCRAAGIEWKVGCCCNRGKQGSVGSAKAAVSKIPLQRDAV